jgi:hypothetical protein
MPLALVQELDEKFLVIEASLKVLCLARELEELEKKRWWRSLFRTVEMESTAYIDRMEKAYWDAVGTIHGYSHVPLICAVIAKLVDLLVGPLRWSHVASYYAMVGVTALARKQKPTTPIIMVAFLSIMPAVVSGSLTRLAGAFFCFDTVYSPLVLYTLENFPDRTEVRWVLIGMLLDFIYLTAAALLTLITSIGIVSIGFVILIYVGYSAAISRAVKVIYESGPWDKYFKRSFIGDSQRSVQHPISKFLEASARYIVQLCMFPLNRVVRSLLALLLPSDPSEDLGDAQGTEIFKYKPIEGYKTIRLLRINQGQPSERIQCRLEDAQLGTSVAYEAVSYVWGNSKRERSIIVDDGILPITKSAYDIIHRRRSIWRDQLIWIDHVCINQDDIVEKASQVELMEDIYKEATRVIAFLGHSVNAHLVQSLFAELHFKMEGLGMSAESLKAQLVQSLRASKKPQWNALAEFFGSQWFRRVWIIQEAAFAQELHLFYGNICMDWKYVSRAVSTLSHRQILEAFRPSDIDKLSFSDSYQNALIGLTNVDIMLEFRGDVNYKKKLDLALVLKKCCRFGATDARDKVYALRGLTKDDSKTMIKPNYNEDARYVYRRAMRIIFRKPDSPLDALTGAGIGFERSLKDLESWVPDWSHTAQVQIIDNRYTAGSRYKATIKIILRDPLSIALAGKKFDEMEHLGPVWEVDSSMTIAENESRQKNWFAANEALARAHARDPYHNGEPLREAFVRTLIGNQASYEDKKKPSAEQCYSDYEALTSFYATSEMLRMIEALCRLQPSLADLPFPGGLLDLDHMREITEKATNFLHFTGVASCFRRFCVTKEGRMAIVPPKTLPGDIVCIIKGARMPYVLRELEEAAFLEGEEQQLYNLVGCCYVHGSMDGEMLVEKVDTFIIE